MAERPRRWVRCHYLAAAGITDRQLACCGTTPKGPPHPACPNWRSVMPLTVETEKPRKSRRQLFGHEYAKGVPGGVRVNAQRLFRIAGTIVKDTRAER